MYLYMMVTRDKYELPLIVTESTRELANFAGVKINAIHSAIHNKERRNQKFSRFVRVEVDPFDDCEGTEETNGA